LYNPLLDHAHDRPGGEIHMKRRTVLAAAAVVPLMRTHDGRAQSGEPVRIGFHAPLTGFAAADGKSAQLGAILAIDQANAEGGVNGRKVELVVLDDQGRPEQGVAIANRLIGDKVPLVVSGSYSGPTRAAAPIFQQARMPFISSYAIHPDITRAGNFCFRTSFVGEVQGRAGAKLVGEMLKLKRTVVITVNNDFGQSLAAGFKEVAARFGVEIVKEYSFGMPDRQFGPLVASVKADNPQAIYASGYFFNAGPLVAQLRGAGVTAQIIGQEGYDGQKFIEIAGPAAEGVIITTSLDRDSQVTETRKFITDFEKSNPGVRVDMVAASTHTAVRVAVRAMRQAGLGDAQKIRDAIAATDMEVSTGRITFNKLGEVRKSVQNQIVRNGEWRFHSMIDDPVLLAPPEA
jgi:branched-chain amino acid transport system substrate-binding protein